MGKNPPQILFRILRPDEGNGLAGVVSRNISSNIPEEQLVEFPGYVYHCHILPH